MSNIKFFVFKLKSMIIPSCICFFIICLLIFSNNTLSAAKNGITLWFNSVLPSLLPFFIATELLNYTNVIPLFGKLLNPIMRPIFNVPGEGAFALVLGIITGYPVGAKIVSNLKEQGACTDIEAERLIAFTNNSGPLFIIGTVGIGIFLDVKIGFILLITHILAALTVGFLFRWWKKGLDVKFEKNNPNFEYNHNSVSFSNLGEVLSKSIFNSIRSVVIIGGFIMLFSVIVTILKDSKLLYIISFIFEHFFNFIGNSSCINAFIIGLIEVTNGLFSIANITFSSIYSKIYLCTFLLGFGGFSVLLQVLSITAKAHISIKPYVIGKILQAIFSTIYVFLLL